MLKDYFKSEKIYEKQHEILERGYEALNQLREKQNEYPNHIEFEPVNKK